MENVNELKNINYDNYQINIKQTKLNIEIIIKDGNNNVEYSSEYRLDFLKAKFEKNFDFNELTIFYNCLKDNIIERKLIIEPPYEKVINTIWKIYPKNNSEKSFTLISYKVINKKLSLLFFSSMENSKDILKKINIPEPKSQSFQLIINNSKHNPIVIKSNYFCEYKYEDNFLIDNIIFFNDMKTINDKLSFFAEKTKELKKEFRKILIFFYEKNLVNNIIKLIIKEELYCEQIFIIIINRGEENNKKNSEFPNTSDELKLELKYKINKFNDIQKCYFDINNIFIINNNEYEKIYISLLKIYNYFNQLGDGFYLKVLDNQDFQKEMIKNEFSYLYNTHNFNILLWGETGSGKSTFINAIMGEKKAYTQFDVSRGTFQDNYYIHKDYPIKIIDVCGFSQNEAKINSDKIKNIYEKNNNNILIDINDNFSFNKDHRNKIHLLLFFTIYNNKLDIKPCNMPVITTASSKGIPIIIVISKAEILFQSTNKKDSEDSEDSEDENLNNNNNLMDTFKIEIEKTKTKIYKDIKESLKNEGGNINNNELKIEFVCIDNISKNGLDNLLEIIYNKFKDSLISDADLDKLRLNKITKEDLKKVVKNSIFLGSKNLDEMILDEAIYKSTSDIKELLIKYFGFYENKLKFFQRIGFFFQRNYYEIWNKIKRRSNTFPMLKNLVKQIFKNFGIDKSDEECTKIIIDYINEYFDINIIYIENNNSIDKNKGFKESISLDIQNNYNLIEENDISTNIIENKENKIKNLIENNEDNIIDNRIENKENNFINNIIENNEVNIIDNRIENKENKIKNLIENNEDNIIDNRIENKENKIKNLIENNNKIIKSKHINIENIKEENNIDNYDDNDDNDDNDDDNIEFGNNARNLCQNNNENYDFKDKFFKDYSNLGNFFMNSNLDSEIDNKIKNEFSEVENLEYFPVKNILDYVRKKFDPYNKNIQITLSKEIKKKMKLFFISYICNEVINEICGNIYKKGFKYKSICVFFYNVLKLYNDAISGFISIKNQILEDKKNLENYSIFKKENKKKPKTIIVPQNK